jgi:hypothetical protein
VTISREQQGCAKPADATTKDEDAHKSAIIGGHSYTINIGYTFIMKKAVSITLEEENLLWLRGQAAATSRGSLSEVLDRLVTGARVSGQMEPGAIRSVKGTIDLPDDDPALEHADAYIRSVFDTSLRRPVLVKETSTSDGGRSRKKARRGG